MALLQKIKLFSPRHFQNDSIFIPLTFLWWRELAVTKTDKVYAFKVIIDSKQKEKKPLREIAVLGRESLYRLAETNVKQAEKERVYSIVKKTMGL